MTTPFPTPGGGSGPSPYHQPAQHQPAQHEQPTQFQQPGHPVTGSPGAYAGHGDPLTQPLPGAPHPTQQLPAGHDPYQVGASSQGYAHPVQAAAPGQYGYASQYAHAGQYAPAHQYAHANQYGPGALTAQRRPITIWFASILIWLGCLALLAVGVGAFVLRASVDWSPATQAPTIFDGLGTVLSGALVVFGAFAIAAAAVMGLLTYGAFRGNNACRWIIIILYGLSLLQLVPGVVLMSSELGSQMPVDLWMLLLIGAVIPALFIVLWTVPPASSWYRYRAALRTRSRTA